MTFTHELGTDLTFELASGVEAYVYVRSHLSSCVMCVNLIDTTGAYQIQSSLESTEVFTLPATTKNDLIWENIKVDGVEYATITFDIPSIKFTAPNILYFKNTSSGTERIRVSLRGNR